MTITVKGAVLAAAEQLGRDGRGEDGLVGFLQNIAATQPKMFAPLLGEVLRYQVTEGEPEPEKVYRSAEEIREELRSLGIQIDRIFPLF